MAFVHNGGKHFIKSRFPAAAGNCGPTQDMVDSSNELFAIAKKLLSFFIIILLYIPSFFSGDTGLRVRPEGSTKAASEALQSTGTKRVRGQYKEKEDQRQAVASLWKCNH